jgi:hypothetical protein
VFIWVLHIFHTYVVSFHPNVAYVFTYMMLHMFCNGYTRVSDVCCKCFNCFRRILQIFSLDVAKVELMLHILQWTLFGLAYMRVGVEGARAAARETCVGADRDRVGIGHGAARDTDQARDTEWRGTPREAGVRRGRLGSSSVRTLAFPS